MAEIKLVVIGAGLIGREHCALIAAHPGASLVGIADFSPDAEQFASQIKAPYFSNYEKMLDQTQPDGGKSVV